MVAVPEQDLSEPARHYNALLEDPGLARASSSALYDGQRSCDIYFGDRPLSVALRPHLVSRANWDRTVAASQLVFSALRKLEARLLEDAALRAELDLDAEEEALVLAEPPCGHSSPSSRLDGFFTDELRYVEYNAESPAGMGYYDNLVDVFDDLPVMKEFRRRYMVSAMQVQSRQTDVMLHSFREWGRAPEPVVAIVDWQDVPTLKEHRMFQEHFEAMGIRALMCDPRDLEFRKGTLYAAGEPVTLVYRRVLTKELLHRGPEASEALCAAYKAGAVCVVNTFRAKLLHRKLSLGLLTDERCSAMFDRDETAAINRHVPWTRKVKAGRSLGPDGKPVDVLDYIARNRETLALKPNDDYGGKGVVLGWTVSQDEWDAAVRSALDDSYVVQQKVDVPHELFPVALNGLEFTDMIVDVDPYLFFGRVAGCLTRLSSSALLNVTAGAGSVVPAYIVEGMA